MKTLILTIALCLLAASPCLAEKTGGKTVKVIDSVKAALGHSPSLKAEGHAMKAQKHTVREAKSGYLPKLDVEGQTGAGTLPVSRNE